MTAEKGQVRAGRIRIYNHKRAKQPDAKRLQDGLDAMPKPVPVARAAIDDSAAPPEVLPTYWYRVSRS
jgi:hypothetical protein